MMSRIIDCRPGSWLSPSNASQRCGAREDGLRLADPDRAGPGELAVVLGDAGVVPVGSGGGVAAVVPADGCRVIGGADQAVEDEAFAGEGAGEGHPILDRELAEGRPYRL